MIEHDYHMHSCFSPDSRATMSTMCAAAVAKRIPEIGFAEHYDLHPDENPRDWLNLDAWAAELERCRSEYAGRLIVRAGIEVGEAHLFATEVRTMMKRYAFDYAIGSLHWVGRSSVLSPAYFKFPPDEAYGRYFRELERMTRTGGFEILGHLDVPIRAACEVYGGYDPGRYEHLIRPVLSNCINGGISIEINTGSLRRKAGVLTPGLAILRWYAEMGGEHLTLGSDAHLPGHVGADLDVALTAARTAGLKYLTMYENRRARMIPLA